MKTVPGQLRGKAIRSSPCLAMSATATNSEIEEIQEDLGLRASNTVVLRSDPVQTQFNYIRVQRPPNIYGSFGSENSAGEMQPGLIDTVITLYLNKYVEKVNNGEVVKKAILLFRNEDDIADVYDELSSRLPEHAADPLCSVRRRTVSRSFSRATLELSILILLIRPGVVLTVLCDLVSISV